MTTTGFHWSIDVITPRLKQEVGSIVLYWALIEWQFTEICERFWRESNPGREKLPPRFDRRAAILLDQVKAFYAKEYPDEPEEFRQFAWFMQRLKTANGKRDALVHGLPGVASINGRKFPAIETRYPSEDAKYVQMSLDDIGNLDLEIWRLYAETCKVSRALNRALDAASPNKSRQLVGGEYVLLTKQNRDPKLPRETPPPPTFRS